MSFMIYPIRCSQCEWQGETSFGIVGMTQIAAPAEQCPACGAPVRRVEHAAQPTAAQLQRAERILTAWADAVKWVDTGASRTFHLRVAHRWIDATALLESIALALPYGTMEQAS